MAAVARHGAPGTTRTLAVVFLSLLIDLLGFTVILPLMPSLLEYYSRHDQDGLYGFVISKVDGFRAFIGAPDTERFNLVLLGGLLGSLFSFLQFLVSPLIGASSDMFGRKPVLICTMVGVASSYALWVFSYDFGVFVLARIIGGVCKGNVSLSATIVADVTSTEKRSKGMALIGVAFSLGFILGPMVGAMFSIWGKQLSVEGVLSFSAFQYPAIFALVMACSDVLFLASFFQETLPMEKRATSLGAGIKGAVHLINPISLFKYDSVRGMSHQGLKNLRLMSVAYFMYIFLFSGLEYSLTFLVHQRLHYDSMQQGKMFLFIGVIMVLVQGGYLRRRPPGKEKQTAISGILATIPGMLTVGFSSSTYMLCGGLVLYSFGAGTVVPSLTAIASKYGDGDEKGKVMGIFRSLGALARGLGPMVACTVYWNYSACVCYMTGGLLLVVPALTLCWVDASVNKPKEG